MAKSTTFPWCSLDQQKHFYENEIGMPAIRLPWETLPKPVFKIKPEISLRPLLVPEGILNSEIIEYLDHRIKVSSTIPVDGIKDRKTDETRLFLVPDQTEPPSELFNQFPVILLRDERPTHCQTFREHMLQQVCDLWQNDRMHNTTAATICNSHFNGRLVVVHSDGREINISLYDQFIERTRDSHTPYGPRRAYACV